MSHPVNWGVLGASRFALQTMAPSIHEATGARLAAVATRDPAKAAPFAEFAPDIAVHDSYDALLADPTIDAVYIPLPNGLHVEWTEKAARAGKAVLCEKPIGMSVADLDRLMALREETGLLIAEAWMPAHHPQWSQTRAMLADGVIGRLHTVTGVFTYGLADPANVRNSAALGGGALRDVGVYPIGAFRLATGLEPTITSADAIWEDGIDSSTWVTARAQDVRFSFHVSMRTSKRQQMVFEGDGGWLALDAPFNAGGYGEASIMVQAPDGSRTCTRFPTHRQYATQVEAFSASLRGDLPYPMPLEASRGTQAVVDAVFDALGAAG